MKKKKYHVIWINLYEDGEAWWWEGNGSKGSADIYAKPDRVGKKAHRVKVKF